jgi:lantibiotic biosynthesis protein
MHPYFSQIQLKRIDEKLRHISEILMKNNSFQEGMGLLSGKAGELLFLFNYAKYTSNLKIQQKAEKDLYYIGEHLENTDYTYCTGLCGIGWFFKYLNKHHFIEIDENIFFQEFDDTISGWLLDEKKNRCFDYLKSPLGTCLYLSFDINLKDNMGCVNAYIDYIDEITDDDIENNKYYFSTLTLSGVKCEVIDLGIAHGLAGLLLILSKLSTIGTINNKIFRLIEKITNYIVFALKKNENVFFTSYVLKKTNKNNENIKGDGFGWCYGGIGILYSIFLSSKILRKKDTEIFALNLLKKHLLNFDYSKYLKTTPIEACICHGICSKLQILYRLFLHTKTDFFKIEFLKWVTILLDSDKFDGMAGYYFGKNENSLLQGISGIGMVLLSLVQEDYIDWDESILLS